MKIQKANINFDRIELRKEPAGEVKVPEDPSKPRPVEEKIIRNVSYMQEMQEEKWAYELKMKTFPTYTYIDFPAFTDHFNWNKLLRPIFKRYPSQPDFPKFQPRLINNYLIAKTEKGSLFFISKIYQMNRYFLRTEGKKSVEKDKIRRHEVEFRREEDAALRFALDIVEKQDIKTHNKFFAVIKFAKKRHNYDHKRVVDIIKKRYKDKIHYIWNPAVFHLERQALDGAGSSHDPLKLARALILGKSIGNIIGMLAHVKRNIKSVTFYQVAERVDGYSLLSEAPSGQIGRLTRPIRRKKEKLKAQWKKEIKHRDYRHSVHDQHEKAYLESIVTLQKKEARAIRGYWQMMHKKYKTFHPTFEQNGTNIAAIEHKNVRRVPSTVLYQLSVIKSNNPLFLHELEVRKIEDEKTPKIFRKRIKKSLAANRRVWDKIADQNAAYQKECYNFIRNSMHPVHRIFDARSHELAATYRQLDKEDPAVVLYHASEMRRGMDAGLMERDPDKFNTNPPKTDRQVHDRLVRDRFDQGRFNPDRDKNKAPEEIVAAKDFVSIDDPADLEILEPKVEPGYARPPLPLKDQKGSQDIKEHSNLGGIEGNIYDQPLKENAKNTENKLVQRNIYHQKIAEQKFEHRVSKKADPLPFTKDISENVVERQSPDQVKKHDRDQAVHLQQNAAANAEKSLDLKQIREMMSQNKTTKK